MLLLSIWELQSGSAAFFGLSSRYSWQSVKAPLSFPCRPAISKEDPSLRSESQGEV